MVSSSTSPPSLKLQHLWPTADKIEAIQRGQLTSPGLTRRARSSLLAFAQHTFPGYQPAAHHQLIAEKLEAVERDDIDRLMIFMPPRFGKSELASIRFPAWYLGRNPDKRIIGASYAAQLAYRFSRQARNVVASALWPFEVRLAHDSAAVHAWDIAGHRGGYIAAGVGGPITGMGAHLLIIDDPIKNADEADSATYRDNVWEWYQSTAYTRLERGGAIVLIMTRWHHDDLAGRLLREAEAGGDQWEVLTLPAISPAGEPLWPAKFDRAALERIRRAVGSRTWTALYQQQPTDDEGALIKREWWQYWRDLPACDRVIQLWDTAFKTGTSNDYSVCATWGRARDGYYLIDRWRGRVEFPDLKRQVVREAETHRPAQIYIEDAASGQSLIQELKRETRLPITPVKVDRDKVARVNAVTPLIESGKVFLPASATWLGEFIEEHAQFPHGLHDDQVDTTSMALTQLRQSRKLVTF